MTTLFDKTELLYALLHLANEKTLGTEGLSKEIMVEFWDDVFDTISIVINEAWTIQCMNHIAETRSH